MNTAGTLYITDQGNQVRKVSNGVITAAACDGTYGYVGDNVPALSAQCKYPAALTVDAAGNLYFADTGNGYVREVTPDGIIHTVAGIGKQAGDGIPAVNALVSPNSLTVDAAGNLYIGDNGAIRKVTNGMIDTIAGGGYLPSGNDFARSGALGSIPGIAVDPAGKIYFSDSGHQTVRVATPQSGIPVSISSIRNAGSNLQSWISPGEIIVITGSDLGPADLTMGGLTVDGVFDTQVAGASVQINGVPAPMIYASAQQVAAVAPYGAVATGPPLLNGVTVTFHGSVSTTARIAGATMAAWTVYWECQWDGTSRRRESRRHHQQRCSSGRARQRDFPLCDRRGRHHTGRNRWQARLITSADPIDAVHRDNRRPDGHSRVRRRRTWRNRRPDANQRAHPREPCPRNRRARYRAGTRLCRQPAGCHNRRRKLTRESPPLSDHTEPAQSRPLASAKPGSGLSRLSANPSLWTKLRLKQAQRGLLRRGADLFFVFLDFHGFKIFCLENLAAIETFHVIDAVSTGDHLGASVFTSGRHNKRLDEVYFTHVQALVKPPST